MFGILSGRTTGAFPISIGTSIALEFYTGTPSEVNKEGSMINPGHYKQFWINLKTLIRNILGAIPSDKKLQVMAEELTDALYTEMEVIANIIHGHDPDCEIVYYVSNYKGIDKKFKEFSIRVPKTELQKVMHALFEKSIHLVLKKNDNPEFKVAVFDLKLNGAFKKTLRYPASIIITHCAYDLVSAKEFDELVLLESHTGTLKHKNKWHSKYINGNDIPFIPFCERLLPIFGDSDLFYPVRMEIRDNIISVAKKFNWSSITTDEKILYGIRTLNNQFLIDHLLSI